MKLQLYIKLSYSDIKNNKRRAFISITAIAIGIISMILLTSISKGLNENVGSMLKGFGSKTLVVIPLNVGNALVGSTTAGFAAWRGRFYESDVEKLKTIDSIDVISKAITGRAFISYNNESKSISVYGIEAKTYQIFAKDLKIKKGRMIRKNSYEALIGGKVSDSFSKELKVGKTINISGKEFKIVGVLEETGNSISQLDNIILIPYSKAREMFKDIYSQGEISSILISIKEGYDVKKAREDIEKKLLKIKKIKEDEKFFTIVSRDFIENSVKQITFLLNIFFSSLSLISIIVGLIGIGNTIYMTIVEKTKEIGTLRAVGMKKNDILLLYIFQAILLSIIAFVLGFLISILLIEVLKSFIPISLDLFFVFISLVISIFGTVVASYFPSKKASSIPPAEALVYE